jgi:hypothetical protein
MTRDPHKLLLSRSHFEEFSPESYFPRLRWELSGPPQMAVQSGLRIATPDSMRRNVLTPREVLWLANPARIAAPAGKTTTIHARFNNRSSFSCAICNRSLPILPDKHCNTETSESLHIFLAPRSVWFSEGLPGAFRNSANASERDYIGPVERGARLCRRRFPDASRVTGSGQGRE